MGTKREDQLELTASADELFMEGIRHRYGAEGTPVDDQKARCGAHWMTLIHRM